MRAPLTGKDPAELLGADLIEDPHPFYARLRAEHPISRVGDSGVHLVVTWSHLFVCLPYEGTTYVGERDDVWYHPDPRLRDFIERRLPAEDGEGMDVIHHIEVR